MQTSKQGRKNEPTGFGLSKLKHLALGIAMLVRTSSNDRNHSGAIPMRETFNLNKLASLSASHQIRVMG